uniref:Uncharacterized protein n=1 Tax=Gopherus evgoodei TaxID=1825980 RepID=A0A8C4WGK0_9SAUR
MVGQVSVCQQCCKAYPGKMKGKQTQKETSAELHGLQDIVDSQGFDGTVNSKLPRDQPPIKICKKCSKLRWKRPAGSAGADLPTRSHGIPKRWTPGDSSPCPTTLKPHPPITRSPTHRDITSGVKVDT